MNTVKSKIDVIKTYYAELDQAKMLDNFDWSAESIDEEFTIIKLMEVEN